jgi:hypothetical protein
MEPVTHSIDLTVGHQDKQGKVHTRVVFGHRVTAADLFNLDVDPQAQNPTQYGDLIIRAHITEFGSLKLPVPLTVLLSLDSVDREDLLDGCNIFQSLSGQDHEARFLGNNRVKLGFGFVVNGVVYEYAQFGNRLTGMDEVEADRLSLKGVTRSCFLIGKQLVQISDAEGTATIDGPIPVEYFGSLDGADVATLRGAAELWRQSFRVARTPLSRNGRGPHGPDVGDAHGMERGADPADATRPS